MSGDGFRCEYCGRINAKRELHCWGCGASAVLAWALMNCEIQREIYIAKGKVMAKYESDRY